MNISGIDTKYQNYTTSGNPNIRRSGNASAVDSFENEIVNWEKRVKENLDKEQENDKSGNIQMSEKQWRNLIKKVDNAIDTFNENIKEQKQDAKKQADEKNLVKKQRIE